MSNYTTTGCQYDSSVTTAENGRGEHYNAYDVGSAATLTSQVVYQLSNNGTFYANDQITDIFSSDGKLFSDALYDRAGNNWFYTDITYYGRTHDSSFAGSTANTETVVFGRKGITYITDYNASGKAGASEQINTSTGELISKTATWSNGTNEGDYYYEYGATSIPTSGTPYDTLPSGNTDPEAKPASQAGSTLITDDLQSITSSTSLDLMRDFALMAGVGASVKGPSLLVASMPASTYVSSMQAMSTESLTSNSSHRPDNLIAHHNLAHAL